MPWGTRTQILYLLGQVHPCPVVLGYQPMELGGVTTASKYIIALHYISHVSLPLYSPQWVLRCDCFSTRYSTHRGERLSCL